MSEEKIKSYLLVLPIFLGLFTIHYFTTREDTLMLIAAYSIGFVGFLASLKYADFSAKEILILGIGVRMMLFFSLPNLSDDFYRFIWDGRLIDLGINPFSHTPEFYIQGNVQFSSLSLDLYEKLNSQSYFTIYPPISQLLFWLSATLSPNSIAGSVLVLRLILLFFEIGSLILIVKLLKQTGLSVSNTMIYACNPLVILEITGNLHFEGVMLFFLLGFAFLFQKNKTQLSALAISLGIATKLVPLMFLPFALRKMKLNKSFAFYIIAGTGTVVLFMPFIDLQFIHSAAGSLDLFFRKFEFNSGLFFLFREVGYYNRGFDMISKIGPWMSISALVLILSYSLFIIKKTTYLPTILITILFIQLSLSTTVHPWYIIPLIAFAALSEFRFPIIWSFLIFLTYSGYSYSGFAHPFLIISIEYIIVIPFAIYEIVKFHKNPMTNPDPLLIIFIKNPKKGKVKTRLAKVIGDDKALNVYNELLNHTHSITNSLSVSKNLYYSQRVDKNDIWSSADYAKKVQQGEELGSKMSNAFSDGFEDGKDPICIIGSDCFELSEEILLDAFEKLKDFDFVIGPAKDGGYYLLGMNEHSPALFKDKVYSTSEVFKEAINEIKYLNKSYFLLPKLSDIDTANDLNHHKTFLRK